MAPDSPELPPLVGQAPAFLDLLEEVSLVAPLDRPVLVIGERGTGKELIASRLHYLSSRWDRPLITLNAAALPETLRTDADISVRAEAVSSTDDASASVS